jgi:hypothetical protein
VRLICNYEMTVLWEREQKIIGIVIPAENFHSTIEIFSAISQFHTINKSSV